MQRKINGKCIFKYCICIFIPFTYNTKLKNKTCLNWYHARWFVALLCHVTHTSYPPLNGFSNRKTQVIYQKYTYFYFTNIVFLFPKIATINTIYCIYKRYESICKHLHVFIIGAHEAVILIVISNGMNLLMQIYDISYSTALQLLFYCCLFYSKKKKKKKRNK